MSTILFRKAGMIAAIVSFAFLTAIVLGVTF